MRIKNYFNKFTVFALILFSFTTFTFAQTTNLPPREQKLLNGLKLLVWQNANAEKASVKLRIHNGSAFDPQTKEGVMALLGEILFPNETVKEYFEQDLGGSLSVESNYDYIQINATGDNDKILDILEALATAVTKPQVDKDTTAKIKTAKLEKVIELEKNPAYVADQAVAKRLFGNYPYGRPQMGTSESVSKIDFADVLLAKQKFLTADNATLVVSGNVKFDLIYRAARRLFGGWEKADKKIPATFTQPDAPLNEILKIESPVENITGMRLAFRSLARGDKDYFASQIYVNILRKRLMEVINPGFKNAFFIRQESHFLPGFIVFGYTSEVLPEAPKIEEKPVNSNKPKSFKEVMTAAISDEEFTAAKAAALAEINKKTTEEMWLDVDTFKLVSVKDELQKTNNVTLADVQKVLENLTKNPMIGVSLISPTKTDKPKSDN